MSDVESIPEVEIEDDLEIVEDTEQDEIAFQTIENESQEATAEGTNENQDGEEATAEGTNQNQADADEDRKVVKPKRVIKNPQPKLNEQTLKGARGLSALESYFERVKFKGRGYEDQDLNVLMKTYEYWCHRLFPKFPFDACIARLETLGTKRATQTQIKRIRMGITIDDENLPNRDADSSGNEMETNELVEPVNDPFDQLLSSTSTSPPVISEEQMEQIRQNKEKAEKLRQERLKKIREKSSSLIEPSQTIIEENTMPTVTNQIARNDDSVEVDNRIEDNQEVDFNHILNEINDNYDDVREKPTLVDEVPRITKAHRRIQALESDEEIDSEPYSIEQRSKTYSRNRSRIQTIESDDEFEECSELQNVAEDRVENKITERNDAKTSKDTGVEKILETSEGNNSNESYDVVRPDNGAEVEQNLIDHSVNNPTVNKFEINAPKKRAVIESDEDD